jgi:catechol 2,3-dioxygenase-like lactoylglutathione lyase family enzyme
MHVSLYVSDLSKSKQFYNLLFDKTPVKEQPGYTKYVLEQPSLIISFIENKERVQANFGHLGIQVETLDQLKEWHEKAKSLGIVSKEEFGTRCCYALQDKFWANDPDGVQWEIYYFHEDATFNDPHYEMTDASACCINPISEEIISEEPKFSLI